MKQIIYLVVLLLSFFSMVEAGVLNKGGGFIDIGAGGSNYYACGISENTEKRCYGDAKSIGLGYISKVHISKDTGYKAQFGVYFERSVYDNARFEQIKMETVANKLIITQKLHFFESDLFEPFAVSINMGYQFTRVNEVNTTNKSITQRNMQDTVLGATFSYDISSHWGVGLGLLTSGGGFTLNNNKGNGGISETSLKIRYIF